MGDSAKSIRYLPWMVAVLYISSSIYYGAKDVRLLSDSMHMYATKFIGVEKMFFHDSFFTMLWVNVNLKS